MWEMNRLMRWKSLITREESEMKRLIGLVVGAALASVVFGGEVVPPERLEARKVFAELKFGIFLHWGLYASFAQGEWYLERGELKESEYAKAANAFYPHAFDAWEWVKAFKAAGAKYVVFTTRHHDGFSMFDTKTCAYDIVDATPFRRDVVKELAEACREEGMRLGLYYSLMDWHRPDYPTGREKKARASLPKGQEDYDRYFARNLRYDVERRMGLSGRRDGLQVRRGVARPVESCKREGGESSSEHRSAARRQPAGSGA